VTPAEADVTVGENEDRTVCVFVRAIKDERLRAEKCFSALPPSPPPPPPIPEAEKAALAAALLARQVRTGGSDGQAGEVVLSSEEQSQQEAEKKQKDQFQYLEKLSNGNGALNDILGPILEKVKGRRLWQRQGDHNSHHMEDAILSFGTFGNAPIQGVTNADCSALCAALNVGNQTCDGIAYARLSADPRELELRQCYLLRSMGGCTPMAFASAIWGRRDTDGCTQPTAADNPFCVQMAQGR
jgi:hypothetical protein